MLMSGVMLLFPYTAPFILAGLIFSRLYPHQELKSAWRSWALGALLSFPLLVISRQVSVILPHSPGTLFSPLSEAVRLACLVLLPGGLAVLWFKTTGISQPGEKRRILTAFSMGTVAFSGPEMYLAKPFGLSTLDLFGSPVTCVALALAAPAFWALAAQTGRCEDTRPIGPALESLIRHHLPWLLPDPESRIAKSKAGNRRITGSAGDPGQEQKTTETDSTPSVPDTALNVAKPGRPGVKISTILRMALVSVWHRLMSCAPGRRTRMWSGLALACFLASLAPSFLRHSLWFVAWPLTAGCILFAWNFSVRGLLGERLPG